MIALFYLALIFVITGATILVTQILSDCGKHKKQYDILRHIGMSTQTVNQTVNKQLAAFFLLPVIPAVVIDQSDAEFTGEPAAVQCYEYRYAGTAGSGAGMDEKIHLFAAKKI